MNIQTYQRVASHREGPTSAAISISIDPRSHWSYLCKIGRQDTYTPPDQFMLRSAMTRLARMVFPGVPHHVTQRGNRREAIFFEDGDQEIYRDLLAEQSRK